MLTLRQLCYEAWLVKSSQKKAHDVHNLLNINFTYNTKVKLDTIGVKQNFDINCLIAGQPTLNIQNHINMPKRNLHTLEGKIAMLHALAHIEFNAINLALDAIWRFPNLPFTYYLDWLKVALEEAKHFSLLNNYLNSLGSYYGQLAVHNGLWDMAVKTHDNLLARLAMVPRTLEARGLDMAPMIYTKLKQAKDETGSQILSIILHDELEHVLIGNKWYEYLCYKNNLNPITTYANLINIYDAPKVSMPFNQLARLNAGFYPSEIKQTCTLLNITYEL